MKRKITSSDLPMLWDSPDNSRLIPKQISIRLPVHVAAKLFALEEIYPLKTRTQIIGDLLYCALTDIEEGLPEYQGEQIGIDEHGEPYYDVYGPKINYRNQYLKHLEAIEEELNKPNAKSKK